MPAENVMQLRALLAEKFPGLRQRLGETPATPRPVLPTGVPPLDQALHGGFSKGALVEIIVPSLNCGSSTLLAALLEQTARANEIVALIDGHDSFNPRSLEERVLARLLWVRCHSAAEAVKAADLVLRDGNLPLVLLDLRANPEPQLRKVPASTWYRFQRLVETSGAICLAFAPRRLLASARTRIRLQPRFSLAALERSSGDLLPELGLEVFETHRQAELPGLQSEKKITGSLDTL